MIFRLSIIAVLLTFCAVNGVTQEDLVTDGTEHYWNPTEEELFLMFKKKYRNATKINHKLAIRDHPLFIRLDDEEYRLSKLDKNGKAAKQLKKELLKRNTEVVEAFQELYMTDNYYFYYAKDADRIFKEFDYSYLLKDLTTKATDFDLGESKAVYVLIYRRPWENWANKNFGMHIWDLKKVSRIKHWTFIDYKHLFSNKVSVRKSIEELMEHILD